MTTARRLTLLALVLASANLLVAYGLSDMWSVGLAALLPGGLWLVGIRRGRSWLPHVSFLMYIALSAGAGLRAANSWLALLSLLAALSAWDLTAWQLRLAAVRPEDAARLFPHHLRRLVLALIISLLLFAFTRLVALRLNLWSAIFLGCLLLLALFQTTRLLRKAD